ncbi:universal stress protein [Actinokineospora iranica]|uniref:Nucleotide-binding universal stress protein, UspA family n=1 Tax=Actinokineospora iranica TaxID=1271860 RepID=A0A1G6JS44_9PSEU|nr:universal stress protein [Actinokineospora iranica]SDC21569.1 Nucleotide-binding universal stress protein, UspA family [Actinokineospora iranica]
MNDVTESSVERSVFVGVDGSESAGRVLRWAVAEAGRRGTGLVVVSVYAWPVSGYPDGLVVAQELRRGLRAQAEETVRAAVAVVAGEAPGLAVRGEVREGAVAAQLIACSRDAGVLVLGSRGLGGFSGLLLGSVAVALAAHGHCPVVVVRAESRVPLSGRVVVGVDGGPGDDDVLAFAFAHAAGAGAAVVAVHAWSDTTIEVAHVVERAAFDWGVLARQARDALVERLGRWRAKYPDVPVESVVARERPVCLLLDQAVDASLVVVGSRGRGGFAGLVLGSVSQAVVRHAPCPVAVVRTERTRGDQ